MVDPVPSTRATASRALGSLIEKLGEDQMPDLIPKLIAMLRAENNTGDHLGAAQALSEVIYGVGIKKLEEFLPVILKNVSSQHPAIRESFMNLMIFLPAAFGTSFSPYLSKVIPPILAGLADEVETIRAISLRSGRLIVKSYATRAVDLLLPELERGLCDENYRIRLSSVELTGDLLFQITGVNGKLGQENENEEGDNSGEVHSSLLEVLGQDRRDRILASLYVCRSDVTAVVRNSAVDVWKSLISNTPRTVKEILPVLSQMIIRRLSSEDDEQRENASQTLADLVRRFGETLLTQLLPTLESGLFSNDAEVKHGICIALSEIIETTSPAVLQTHETALVGFVRGALVDSDVDVRTAAAHAFDALQEAFGNKAIDQILPHLLNLLQSSEQSEYALAALKEIMAGKSDDIFPVLIPILLKSPISAFNARALGSLAEVGGSSLYRRLTSLMTSLVNALLEEKDQETLAEINNSMDSIVMSTVDDEDGLELLNAIFIELAEDADSKKRTIAYAHISKFFESSDSELYTQYAKDWISTGLKSLDDGDDKVVENAWQALSMLVSKMDKEDLLKLVLSSKEALEDVGKPGVDVAGFALAKGPNCILPIFLQGLMYGSSEQRENAARGIAAIVERTPATALRPFVTHMTGPLIRTIGERFPAVVKIAILDALTVLLSKIPTFIKPFLPQLQRTFIRSIADNSSEELRDSARVALVLLVEIQPRVEPIITDLVNASKAAGVEDEVRASTLQALFSIWKNMGTKLSESVINMILSAAKDGMTSSTGE